MRHPVWLPEDAPPGALPPPELALEDPDGLLAVGGALTPPWLLHAYRHGVFPWFSAGQPILWWSPDPRMVLPVAEFRMARSLRKILEAYREEAAAMTAGNKA